MHRAGDVFDLSPIGASFHVRKTADDTEGRALEMEWVLAPRSAGTPVHVHPSATESYTVLEGTLDLYVAGTWRTLTVGETASVAPGVAHTFRNAAGYPARVYNTHAPAMRFGDYFESLHRVVSSGLVAPGRMTFRAMMYLSMVMASFEPEIVSRRPPQVLVKALARLARLAGFRVPPPGGAGPTLRPNR
jgi:quercetin dioxygenase-like cupin family protein